MKRSRSCLSTIIVLSILAGLVLLVTVVIIPALAWNSFGAPSPGLNPFQQVTYGINLVMHKSDLTQPRDPNGMEQVFVIQPGESVTSIADHLEMAGLIQSANTFRSYLIWTGQDTTIQTGTYRLSPALTAREIADTVISSNMTDVQFNVLPGWRMEEIAASLPTSGLNITPDAFLQAAAKPANPPGYLPAGASAEGFLFPAAYTLPRSTSADQLVDLLMQKFSSQLTPDLRSGFSDHGLSVYQGVIMASIIQREVIADEEMPEIASVFYNRLSAGMLLQTDPTVQYALGYNAAQKTWWTTPLSQSDLNFDSPYNTYIYNGLPPGPISNPSLAALQAVAFPAQTDYYFFQARCDGSGLHNFAKTLEEHIKNNCP